MLRLIVRATKLRRSALATFSISLNWKAGPVKGQIEIVNGRFAKIPAGISNAAHLSTQPFDCPEKGPARVSVSIDASEIQISGATIVRIKSGSGSFSFFLRDVRSDF